MLFTFLITIVFIAELIITFAAFYILIKADKFILETNSTINAAEGSIKDIAKLGKLISGQLVEFAENFKETVKKEEENFILKSLNKILIALILLKFNSKAIKKIRKSKIFKKISLGLNLLQNMV